MQSNKSSYGPFLETIQQQRNAQAGVVREARRKVLTTLADNGPEPVEKLRQQTRMRFEDFADTVRSLREAELIRIEIEDQDEVVTLTDMGRQLASLDG